MSSSPGMIKHSVTIPADTSEGVRERVGPHGFSAYVADALARQLRRDALEDIIAEMEEKHGLADEDRVAELVAHLSNKQ